jgi:hypothetical protein
MNMSFALTRPQVEDESKTVTRRLGWRKASVGQVVQPVLKCQGLRAGEKVTKIGRRLRLVDVRRESLGLLLDDPHGYGRREVDAEGFPDRSVTWFVEMFCKANKCGQRDTVTRIQFAYED